MIEYRWLTGDEILAEVNPQCVERGWIPLNVNDAQPTCRVLGAFDDETLVGWIAFQLFPLLGPLFVDEAHRDGELSRDLAAQMHDFMVEVGARGALTLCENAASARIARLHGMTKVEDEVYIWEGD